jgi:hypothetical protein
MMVLGNVPQTTLQQLKYHDSLPSAGLVAVSQRTAPCPCPPSFLDIGPVGALAAYLDIPFM